MWVVRKTAEIGRFKNDEPINCSKTYEKGNMKVLREQQNTRCICRERERAFTSIWGEAYKLSCHRKYILLLDGTTWNNGPEKNLKTKNLTTKR